MSSPHAADLLRAYGCAQLDRIRAEDERLRAGDQEGVHQLRVATRRLRSALATYRPVLVPGSTDALRAELKWLGGVLAPARDAQVLRQRLDRLVRAQPVELVLGPVGRRIDDTLSHDFLEAREAALEALDGERYHRLLADLEAFLAEPPVADPDVTGSSSSAAVAGLLHKDLKRVRKRHAAALDAVGPDERGAALHEVRKATKRLRYAAESAQPVHGTRAAKLAKRSQALASLLGGHQDSVVARRALRTLGVQAHLAGENGFTFGRLHAMEEAEAARLERRYPKAYGALPSGKLRSWLDR